MPSLISSTRSYLYRRIKALNTPKDILHIGLTLAILLIVANICFLAVAANSWQRTVINDIAEPIASLMASAGLAYGAYWSARLSARIKTAWAFMTAAAVCSLIGDMVFFIQEAIRYQPTSPSTAELFYLVA